MSLNLKIPGDPAALETVADWLDNKLKPAVMDADVTFVAALTDSNTYWTGQTGDAFRTAAQEVRTRSDGLHRLQQNTAGAIRAYATRLELGQELFDKYLQQAVSVGLDIRGKIVMPPTTELDYCPAPNAPQADIDEYDSYTEKITAYNQISTEYGTWTGELEAWVREHLVPLTIEVDKFAALGELLAALMIDEEDLFDLQLSYADTVVGSRLKEFQTEAVKLQDIADGVRDRQRSGNPAVRAAADAVNPVEMRVKMGALNETIDNFSGMSKIIPVVGYAATAFSVGQELAEGGSPTSIAVELGGGAVGGAAATAGFGAIATAYGASFTVPPVAVVGTVALVATGAGFGARYLYESEVPLNVREGFDRWVKGEQQPILLSGSTTYGY
jgi:hypothetical protein